MNENQIDLNRRKFLTRMTSLIGGVGVLFAAFPFISSWLPSRKTEAAGGPVEVDLSRIEPGQLKTVEWRGKPVWIIRRTPEMMKALTQHDSELRDPQSDVEQQPEFAHNLYRSLKPEYLVLIGICTHLGCTPAYKPSMNELGPGWPGGFYCPCHGSKFDLSGRVFKGVPAPINLQVPPYYFVGENKLVIGETSAHG